MERLFNTSFKIEAYFSESIDNSLKSDSFFRREIVARVQASALSIIAALALVFNTLYIIGNSLASLGFAVIHCKSPFSYATSIRNVLMVLVKFTQNLGGTIAGTIVGVLHPKSARAIFLPGDQSIKEKNTLMNPKEAAELYWMLQEVDTLFKSAGISYTMSDGTLLGHVRHGGIIPWDDDADLMIGPNDETKFINLKDQLKKLGLEVLKCPLGYKIYPTHGKKLPLDEGLGVPLQYNFPFIDIYTSKEEHGNIIPTHDDTRKYFPGEYFSSEEWASIKPSSFGPVKLNFINNPNKFLSRMYGTGYNDYGYQAFSHNTFKVMIPLMFYFKKENGSERCSAIKYDIDRFEKLTKAKIFTPC